MDGLYTNRTTEHDFVLNAIERYGRDCDVKIASAYFSDAQCIRDLVGRNCTVDLVVRLGEGTSGTALCECAGLPGVNLGYYTDSYHPKLFIFGGSCALIGSANLTASGVGRSGPNSRINIEASVLVAGDDPRFDGLRDFFTALWDGRAVLDAAGAAQYADAVRGLSPVAAADLRVLQMFGPKRFGNVEGIGAGLRRDAVWAEGWRRRYQKARAAITAVAATYSSLGPQLESRVPLNIEVDQLFNFIRETRAQGNSYATAPILVGPPLEAKIRNAALAYRETSWPYLAEIAANRYPKINATLGTRDAIESATEDEIWDSLLVIHAFAERARYFTGGLAAMRHEFFSQNGTERTRKALCHLVADGHPSQRLAECIFGADYALHNFGEACWQEALGWLCARTEPICNGRTLKALRWLGFDLPTD